MRSSNPVLSRRGAFGAPQAGPQQAPQYGAPYGQQPSGGGNPFGGNTAQYGQQQAPYGQQMTPDQLNQMYRQQSAGPLQTGRMTVDDVVAKTALTLLTVVVFGAGAWALLPAENYAWAFASMLAAFGLGMFITFRRTIHPALVIGYAALEGIFLGAASHAFENAYSGIVVQAVLGTAAIFVAMLWAYKSGRIRVTARYARIGIAIAIAFVLLMIVNLIFVAFAGGDGVRGGAMGIVFGVIGIALGAFFLSLDFHEVEQLVAAGAPEREAWRAAFGLTLSLVWIYLELLRLLAIFRD
ncbi:Bax inhibitor-1/YccA family membrane protein [Streptodolium elevatio]|uniref:Bax inhibitor-1/YccA family protein n=1 Tax=Streptodolium elevatio TaxID=3157996 RepID=A0ABV3DIN2_9ACTN